MYNYVKAYMDIMTLSKCFKSSMETGTLFLYYETIPQRPTGTIWNFINNVRNEFKTCIQKFIEQPYHQYSSRENHLIHIN